MRRRRRRWRRSRRLRRRRWRRRWRRPLTASHANQPKHNLYQPAAGQACTEICRETIKKKQNNEKSIKRGWRDTVVDKFAAGTWLSKACTELCGERKTLNLLKEKEDNIIRETKQ